MRFGSEVKDSKRDQQETFQILVDSLQNVVHNLVSLLLMQRRKTEVDVVSVLRCAL